MITTEDIDNIGRLAQVMTARRDHLSSTSVHAVGHEAASKAYSASVRSFEKALAKLRAKAESQVSPAVS